MKDYIAIIEKNMPEQIEFLQKLIRCNSEAAAEAKGPNGEVYPFGQGVQDAYKLTEDAAREMGFGFLNADNYGGHIEFPSGKANAKKMGILGHLDVVPAGTGWSFPAYSGEVEDGYIYGRGTTDDKGPVVAALYAMKALKEAGFEPSADIRLIVGLDEETNWYGMDYYMEKVGKPDYGFTPDGDFPVVHAEKGILTFDIVRKLSDKKAGGLELRKLEGGSAANMVPEHARAVVNSDSNAVYDEIRDIAAAFKESHKSINGTEPKISVKGVGKSLEISVEGKSAHGAHPQLGLNAISVLMGLLGQLNFGNDEVNDFIGFYNDHIGYDLNGERIGCALSDDVSGKLTLNVGVAAFDKQAITLTVNVRYPVTHNEEEVYGGIIPVTDKYGMGVVKHSSQDPIYLPVDSPLIKTFMDVYREYTGDMEHGPMAIGGGTYARSMSNCVAFGALFPGDPDLMHRRDERLSLEKFETMTKIYAEAIYKITQEGFEL